MLTFIITKYAEDWLDHDYLKKRLKERGWRELTLQDDISHISLYIGSIFYKNFVELFGNADIHTKNILHKEKEIIVNKENLFKNFKKYYPKKYKKYFPISFSHEEEYLLKKNQIYVIRPVQSYGGKDVYFLKDIIKTKNIINKLKVKYPNIVISEYITNALLLKNKKTHVRIFYFVVYYNNKLHHYMLKKGDTMTAKKEFVLKNFENKDIHDTHGETTDKYYMFPDCFNLEPKIEEEIMYKISDALRTVGKIMNQHNFKNWCYEYKTCYELFGVDLIVTTDYNVKLLEINSHIGLGYKNWENYKKLEKLLDYGIYNAVIKPIFYNEEPDTKYLQRIL